MQKLHNLHPIAWPLEGTPSTRTTGYKNMELCYDSIILGNGEVLER